MASSPAPATPDNTPRRMALNRSFTVPTKISTANNSSNSPQAEIGSAEGIETLYVHPNANIVRFECSSRSNTSPGRPNSSSGTLPWATPTERTMATGRLEIYRVPGSVSFLRSGSLLHTIMPRSQCWCVDGVSKFALRVLSETYYRLELPGETEEDLEEVEKFKLTLQKVLFYEKTPCPFSRTFSVDLPEEPEVRKRRRKSTGPAKKWKLDRVWRPEGWTEPEGGGSEDSASASGSSAASEDEVEPASGQEEAEVAEVADEVKELRVNTSMRSRALASLRSVSAPQTDTLLSTPTSRLRTRVDVDGTVEVSEPVETASTDRQSPRLRTFQAIPTDMPPSPPDSSAGLEYVENRAQSEGGTADERPIDSVESAVDKVEAEAPDTNEENEKVEEESRLDSRAKDDVPASDVAVEESLDALEESKEDLNTPTLQTSAEEDLDDINEASHALPREVTVKEDPTDPPTTASSEEPDKEDSIERPSTPERPTTAEDPYAAIQARILARRSIGGTTSFYPGHKSPTRQSTSSTSSTATITSNISSVSRRSQSSRRQQDFTSAMVKKACSVFLGPPAHLVVIMLRIAARFANGAFGVNSMFYVESPIGSPRKVPGSYHLEGDDVDELDSDWEEDDFGVPLRSPVRLAAMSEGVDGLRERRGWDVD